MDLVRLLVSISRENFLVRAHHIRDLCPLPALLVVKKWWQPVVKSNFETVEKEIAVVCAATLDLTGKKTGRTCKDIQVDNLVVNN